MADITIQIDKQEVYEDVSKVTAYIGGKNVDTNGKTLYDQVFVTDADKEMIDSFFSSATSNVATALEHTLKDMETNDIGFFLTLRMPGNFRTTMEKPLTESIIEYIENSIVAAWCSITKKDEESYATKASALLQQINAMQYLRQRPKRNF
ncbi:hypothetical protein [uncultured Prevotella sp.]|uniref:hypothetical protein n=1 Tax=uncultured Prevotella sp. TaxID=159272 RepID=UPI0027DBDC9F|nr:hypothetical protein [uncultured Prevotella sp.]